MKTLMMMIMTLIASKVNAEGWFCHEGSSKRNGNVIEACGISRGYVAEKEDLAREEAFNNAKKEFDNICDLSSDCKDKNVSLRPMRTECVLENARLTCY